MRRTMFGLACIGLLCSSLGLAQNQNELKTGDPAPDFEAEEWLNTEDAPTLVELRGMVVFVVFFKSFTDSNSNLLQSVNLVANDGSTAFRRQGLIVVGLTDASRKQIETEILNES